jgi:hypothetical protein
MKHSHIKSFSIIEKLGLGFIFKCLNNIIKTVIINQNKNI